MKNAILILVGLDALSILAPIPPAIRDGMDVTTLILALIGMGLIVHLNRLTNYG